MLGRKTQTGTLLRGVLKLLIGAVLMGSLWVFDDTGRNAIKQFAAFRWKYLLAVAVLSVFLMWLSCLKWRLFIRSMGASVSVSRLMKLYVIGGFVNVFIPTTVGGDTTRAYLLGRQLQDFGQSVTTVFLERLTGLITLVVLALGFGLHLALISEQPIIIGVAALVLVSCVAVILVVMRLPLRTVRVLPGCRSAAGLVERVRLHVASLRAKRRLAVSAFLYSASFHLSTAFKLYAACLCVNATPEPWTVIAVMPIILLLQVVPVSPGNLGWWEWCCSVLLIKAGLTMPQGLAAALTLRAFGLLHLPIGGLLMLSEPLRIDERHDGQSGEAEPDRLGHPKPRFASVEPR